MDEMWRFSGGKQGEIQSSNMVTSFWFPGNSCLSTFCQWTEAGEGVVFIHKLSGHMKCPVTHVTDLGRYPTSHRSKNTSQDRLWLFSMAGLNSPYSPQQKHSTTGAARRNIQSLFYLGEERRREQSRPEISVTACSYSSIPMCAERLQCNETPAIRSTKKTWGKTGPYIKDRFSLQNKRQTQTADCSALIFESAHTLSRARTQTQTLPQRPYGDIYSGKRKQMEQVISYRKGGQGCSSRGKFKL